MQQQTIPDHQQLGQWLNEAGLSYHHCGQCQGLHLDSLQAESAILDATLEIDRQVLFLTVIGEVRPSRLLSLSGELSALNNRWPQLKLFVDVNDETLPSLIISHNLCLGAGVSGKQVLHFVTSLSRQMRDLMSWCEQEGYLLGNEAEQLTEPGATPPDAPQALH